MAYTASPPTQAEFFEDRWAAEPSDDGKLRPADRNKASRRQPSRGRRAARAFAHFLITLGIGVGATLAWQYYGDDARQAIANAFPQQLGWLAPQPSSPASAAQITPATTPPAPPAAASFDRQQVKGILLSLAVVNERVDQLATKLDFLQQQMAGEIAKLHASEQDILGKISPPPPQAAALAHKPAPRTPPPAPAH